MRQQYPAMLWKLVSLVDEIPDVMGKKNSALSGRPEQLIFIVRSIGQIALRSAGDIMPAPDQCL